MTMSPVTRLKSLDVQLNRIKKLPNLNKYPNLGEVEFKYNKINAKELNKKLPRKWDRKNSWYKSTAQLQNLVKSITFINPSSIQWANKRLTLEAYVVDSFYNDDNESYTLKEVKFIVQN